ncbi:MAG: fructose-bisphosphate aldolase / 2-amino-3,7-dideoxy-D-threo-hept-6-ulosonate synthase [Thermoleophilaceae bacterium]|nr:fructose-bisphosphate aldolase / 2-amino-3,7-dideoxy-D-threo-hept-6-ulosonate synthase [Thermoleophilaceae bacterium]
MRFDPTAPSFGGFDFRMRRLLASDGRTLVVPLDHATTAGPIGGLREPRKIVAAAAAGGADAVMLRPGLVRELDAPGADRLGVIMALTGRLTRGVDHVALNSVEYAIACGADAVNGEFKFGSEGDLRNVALLAPLAEAAHRYGLPFVVTVYTQRAIVEERGSGAYAHGCRVAEEIGADLIKTSLPDDAEVIAEAVSSVSVPIVQAGGDPRAGGGDSLVDSLRRGVELGLAGAAVGRKAWMSDDPRASIRRLADAVHGRAPDPEAVGAEPAERAAR